MITKLLQFFYKLMFVALVLGFGCKINSTPKLIRERSLCFCREVYSTQNVASISCKDSTVLDLDRVGQVFNIRHFILINGRAIFNERDSSNIRSEIARLNHSLSRPPACDLNDFGFSTVLESEYFDSNLDKGTICTMLKLSDSCVYSNDKMILRNISTSVMCLAGDLLTPDMHHSSEKVFLDSIQYNILNRKIVGGIFYLSLGSYKGFVKATIIEVSDEFQTVDYDFSGFKEYYGDHAIRYKFYWTDYLKN